MKPGLHWGQRACWVVVILSYIDLKLSSLGSLTALMQIWNAWFWENKPKHTRFTLMSPFMLCTHKCHIGNHENKTSIKKHVRPVMKEMVMLVILLLFLGFQNGFNMHHTSSVGVVLISLNWEICSLIRTMCIVMYSIKEWCKGPRMKLNTQGYGLTIKELPVNTGSGEECH